MEKSQKQRLKDEIAYWSRHQELDKFNYNLTTVIFFGAIAIIATSFQVFPLFRGNFLAIISWAIILVGILVAVSVISYLKRYNTGVHFEVRDEMIVKKYEELHGIDVRKDEGFKEKLNREFLSARQKYDWSFLLKNVKYFLIIGVALIITIFSWLLFLIFL